MVNAIDKASEEAFADRLPRKSKRRARAVIRTTPAPMDISNIDDGFSIIDDTKQSISDDRHTSIDDPTPVSAPNRAQPLPKSGARETKTTSSSTKGEQEKKRVGGHTLPRFESRVKPNRLKVLTAIFSRAEKDCPQLTKGLQKPELFEGLLMFLAPFHKKLRFKRISWERGQHRGDNVEKTKEAVAEIFKETVATEIVRSLASESNEFDFVIEKLSSEERKALRSKLDLKVVEKEIQIAANE